MNILYQKQNIEAILTKNTISGYVSYGGLRSCIVDLLYGLLKFDPEERPSAEEALDNPFFRNTHAMLNSRSWNNGQISKDDHGSVDMAPRPSYNFTPVISPHLRITFRVDEFAILLLNGNDPKYYFLLFL